MDCLLRMSNITKSFPGVVALDDVSIAVRRGEIHGLVGENGAGKSTLIKILSGMYSADSGSLEIGGERIRTHTPGEMIKKGVAVIYQELMLAPHMTVAENIFLGRLPTSRGFVDHKRMQAESARICGLLGLDLDPRHLVRDLSVARRQMVEIAKALSRDAKIIVLDEPTAVLCESDLRLMFEVVRKLAKDGVAFIYISHRLKEVFDLVDFVTIMKDGKVVSEGDIGHYDIEKIVSDMVGREMGEYFPKRVPRRGKEILRVKGLTRTGVIDGIDLCLNEGEILAISGLAGAGRTETLRAIIGADKPDSGEIEIFGKAQASMTPKKAIKLGIGILPEERKVAGIFLKQSLTFNISITRFREMLRSFLIVLRKERKNAMSYVEKLDIRPGLPEMLAGKLSGGNQQKVVLSKWLNAKCRILLVDEPTRGIDVGTKYEIYQLLSGLLEKGVAIIMVSSELPEVLGFSDRIMVMSQGRKVAEFDTKDATEEKIMFAATGGKCD